MSSSYLWFAGPETSLNVGANYTNFYPGEPNFVNGTENCLAMYFYNVNSARSRNLSGRWNDYMCTRIFGFVVEYEPFSTSWPAPYSYVSPTGASAGSAYQVPFSYFGTPFQAAIQTQPNPPAFLRSF